MFGPGAYVPDSTKGIVEVNALPPAGEPHTACQGADAGRPGAGAGGANAFPGGSEWTAPVDSGPHPDADSYSPEHVGPPLSSK
jgi:hypothetical protein